MPCRKGGAFTSMRTGEARGAGFQGEVRFAMPACRGGPEAHGVGGRINKDRVGSHHDHPECLPDFPGPEDHLTHLLKIDL